jgi:cell division protease FtsH
MFDELTALLGGRASEEVIFGRVSTGALNDLERVTKQAFNMVVFFGLNDKLGNISYYDSTGQQEYSFQKPYSEKTAQVIDEEVSKLVEKAYKRAVSIIKENKENVEKLANKLLEKEVIFREDLEAIFGQRPYEEEKMKLEKQIEDEVKKLRANQKTAIPTKKEEEPEKMLEEGKKEDT